MDKSSEISGYSADVPILLACLSACLQTPISDQIVSTGHIASSDGDIRMVKGLPEKIAAAVNDSSVSTFIYPTIDQDNSLASLSPETKHRIAGEISSAKSELKMIPICHTDDLLKAVFDDELVLLASLRLGFFDFGLPSNTEKSLIPTFSVFDKINENGFWKVLEHQLMTGEIHSARSLLQAFSRFHATRNTYPKSFGFHLECLVKSLPPELRRLRIDSPLLQTHEIIKLSQNATETDYEDVHLLFKAAHCEKFVSGQLSISRDTDADRGNDNGQKLQSILQEIDSDQLALKIGMPIDSARAAYILNTIQAESFDDFQEVITSFYIHLTRYIGKISGTVSISDARADALALIERAFKNKGGGRAAQAEAQIPNNGGLRFILDTMTDQFKQEEKVKHVGQILKLTIDPLDWGGKVDLMKALLSRLKTYLPEEITSQPAERFAWHYEEVVESYIHSIDQVKSVFRRI